ncbi:MAG: hypothetical protein QM725_16325 [Lacibacter sp.]
MKKLLIYLTVATGVLFNLTSCSKNNMVVDKEVVPPSFAKFNTSTLIGTYYIRSTNTPYKLPIGVTTVSDKDRVITLSYASPTGAAAGTHYNAPATITIPAGKTIDTLAVTGLYSGYPVSSRIDSLKITVGGGDVPKNDYNNTYTILMRKYCDVVLSSLMGAYNNTKEYSSSGAFSYGPYPTAVTGLTATGATTATGYISNIYDWGWNDIQVNLDWTDPANFKVTIPLQLTGGGGATYVRSSAGKTNTFSSCDQTFSLSIDLLDASQVVTSSGYQIRLAR